MKPSHKKSRVGKGVSINLEKSLSRYVVATASLVAVALPEVAEANFSGPYDVANWTFQNTGGSTNGSVNTSGAPNSILLTGGDTGSGMAGTTDFTIVAVASGTVSFDWTFSSFDSLANDFGNFLLNGVPTLLSLSYLPDSGSFSINVNQGDIFGFQCLTTTNMFGAAMLGVSNFNGPTGSVPENGSTLGLLALGVAGVEILRRRIR